MGAEFAKTKGWWNFAKQSNNINMFNPAFCIRIILAQIEKISGNLIFSEKLVKSQGNETKFESRNYLYLASHTVRAEFAKTKGRWNFAKQSNNINMFNPAFCIRIILAPKSHKLIQMVRAQNRPIPGQVVKIVHDDGDEQVKNQEGTYLKKSCQNIMV